MNTIAAGTIYFDSIKSVTPTCSKCAFYTKDVVKKVIITNNEGSLLNCSKCNQLIKGQRFPEDTVTLTKSLIRAFRLSWGRKFKITLEVDYCGRDFIKTCARKKNIISKRNQRLTKKNKLISRAQKSLTNDKLTNSTSNESFTIGDTAAVNTSVYHEYCPKSEISTENNTSLDGIEKFIKTELNEENNFIKFKEFVNVEGIDESESDGRIALNETAVVNTSVYHEYCPKTEISTEINTSLDGIEKFIKTELNEENNFIKFEEFVDVEGIDESTSDGRIAINEAAVVNTSVYHEYCPKTEISTENNTNLEEIEEFIKKELDEEKDLSKFEGSIREFVNVGGLDDLFMILD